MKKTAVMLSVFFLGLLFFFSVARAHEVNNKFFQGAEFLTGYAWSELEEKGPYNSVPVFVDLDFNPKVFIRKSDFYPPGIFQFQIEPFLLGVYDPKANMEVGSSLLLKLGIFPESFSFQPYIKAGVGAVFMTQHAAEQATQLNYIETYVVGCDYFFNKNTAFCLEGRFRHLSNAGRKLPNHGINTNFILVGILRRF